MVLPEGRSLFFLETMRHYRFIGVLVLLVCFVGSSLPVLQFVDTRDKGENNLTKIIRMLKFVDQTQGNEGADNLQQSILFAFQATAGLKTVFQTSAQSKTGLIIVCTKIPCMVTPQFPLSTRISVDSTVSIPYLFSLKSISPQPEAPPPDILV